MGDISAYQKKAYTDLVMAYADQQGSKARRFCKVKTNCPGESASFGYLGSFRLTAKASRHAPTPNNAVDHEQYWATIAAYHGNVLLDETDDMTAFTSPKSEYVGMGGRAIGIKWDEIILTAAVANATYGADADSTETWSTFTDRNGTSHVTAAGGTGLTLAKLRTARAVLAKCDIYDDLVITVSPDEVDDMLQTAEFTSSVYNTVKALVSGKAEGTFMGFEWVESNYTPSGKCIVMQKGVVGLAVGIDRKVRIDERTDLSYAWQVYFEISGGAVRRDPERVYEIGVA